MTSEDRVPTSFRPAGGGRTGASVMLRALRSRNYKLFIAGQGVSLIGTWIQQIALSWLVYTLTHSAFLLGVVGFSSQIGMFVLSPVGGVVADRVNRYRLIVATQSLAMAQALAIGVLVRLTRSRSGRSSRSPSSSGWSTPSTCRRGKRSWST